MHKLDYLLLSAFLLIAGTVMAQSSAQKKLLFGVAYYDEYMPYERLEGAWQLSKKAGSIFTCRDWSAGASMPANPFQRGFVGTDAPLGTLTSPTNEQLF